MTSRFIKVRNIGYDPLSGRYINGRYLILNLDYVVRFEEDPYAHKSKDKSIEGKILLVTTIIDNVAQSMKVTSPYLEGKLETISDSSPWSL